MRLFIKAIAAVLFIFILGMILIRPALGYLAKRELEKIFYGSKVKINSVRLERFNKLSLIGIGIDKKPYYEIKVEALSIFLAPLFKITCIGLQVNAPNFKANGIGLVLNNGGLGNFYLKEVKYNDTIIMSDLSSPFLFKGQLITMEPVSGIFLRGSLIGKAEFSMHKGMGYKMALSFDNLDMGLINEIFKSEKKFYITGRLKGGLYIEGMGNDLKNISGRFTAGEGDLNIKDDTFIKNIALNSDQPLNILMASFKDYKYNNGLIDITKENKDVVLDIRLDGGSGKRDFKIIAHDLEFLKKGEGL